MRQSHLTYYFPTITDLLRAVARHSFQSLAKELAGADARERPGPLAVIAKATRDKRRVRLMLGLVQSADRDDPQAGIRRFIRELRGGLEPLLRSAGLEAPGGTLHSCTRWSLAARCQLARDDNDARPKRARSSKKAIASLPKERP